jgi:serine/threonine protein kinase
MPCEQFLNCEYESLEYDSKNDVASVDNFSLSNPHTIFCEVAEIDLDRKVNFIRTKMLGSGVYGRVYKLLNGNVVKDIRTKFMSTIPSFELGGFREVLILRRLGVHPRIAEMKSVSAEIDRIHIEMDFSGINMYNSNDFWRNLHIKYKSVGVDFARNKFVKSIILQMMDAVRYIHSKKVVHLDISLSNFMFLDAINGEKKIDVSIKLIDFGLSRILPDGCIYAGMICSSENRPPEISILDSKTVISGERLICADLWALGMCIYKLVTGEVYGQKEKINSDKFFRITSPTLKKILEYLLHNNWPARKLPIIITDSAVVPETNTVQD